jgi:hypothetical protein
MSPHLSGGELASAAAPSSGGAAARRAERLTRCRAVHRPRQPPDRWFIDLDRADQVLVPPQWYFEVANPEARLFVSDEYVPLFVERGWQRG